MKVKTLTANSTTELDNHLTKWLSDGWELLGDMQVYKEKHEHAVYGYDVWDNKFSQRVKKND